MNVEPVFRRLDRLELETDGPLQEYIQGILDQWLLIAPKANPSMLEMFRDRDANPLRNMPPWAGEFAGKHLTSAVLNLRVTRDDRLKSVIEDMVRQLITYQDETGYLGPWPKAYRMNAIAPNCSTDPEDGYTWDTWGHYNIMFGLLLWHEESHDQATWNCARRIGDLICDTFLGEKTPRVVDTKWNAMTLPIVHGMCILHRKSGEQRYLDMALQFVDELSAKDEAGKPLAGNYLHHALQGKPFHQTLYPRWEALHIVMAFAELHWITGKPEYRQALEQIWWSILKTDRHNSGSFSSGESAQGSPYHLGQVETCCSIAWGALSVEMLKMTGNSVVADELELTTLNTYTSIFSSTGRWATYNTPMCGVRRASGHHIVFQAREGSPELNCCSVNAPRGFGMLSDWALMRDNEGLVLNYYGPSKCVTPLDSGESLDIIQETDYPRDGKIAIHFAPTRPQEFTLKLRIPYWSRNTRVSLKGKEIEAVHSGSYLSLTRVWHTHDRIDIELDLSPHVWKGEDKCEGYGSLFRGPILLTFDLRYNLEHAVPGEPVSRGNNKWETTGPDLLQPPVLDAKSIDLNPIPWEDWLPPQQLFQVTAADGQSINLCDFGSAGEVGTPYSSWLPMNNIPMADFSPGNPLRSTQV